MVNNEREYFEMEKEKEKRTMFVDKIRSRESRRSVLNYEGNSVSGILYYLR